MDINNFIFKIATLTTLRTIKTFLEELSEFDVMAFKGYYSIDKKIFMEEMFIPEHLQRIEELALKVSGITNPEVMKHVEVDESLKLSNESILSVMAIVLFKEDSEHYSAIRSVLDERYREVPSMEQVLVGKLLKISIMFNPRPTPKMQEAWKKPEQFRKHYGIMYERLVENNEIDAAYITRDEYIDGSMELLQKAFIQASQQ